jgi:hypothetical protein
MELAHAFWGCAIALGPAKKPLSTDGSGLLEYYRFPDRISGDFAGVDATLM